MMWPAFVILGLLGLFIIITALYEAYAAGWNASARYHRNRPRIKGAPDPFWREYR